MDLLRKFNTLSDDERRRVIQEGLVRLIEEAQQGKRRRHRKYKNLVQPGKQKDLEAAFLRLNAEGYVGLSDHPPLLRWLLTEEELLAMMQALHEAALITDEWIDHAAAICAACFLNKSGRPLKAAQLRVVKARVMDDKHWREKVHHFLGLTRS